MKISKARLEWLKKDAVQGFTEYIGLEPVTLEPGACAMRIRLQPRHFQQDGFAHAGLIAALADHTAGYASFSLIPQSRRILTVEFKISYLRPASGEYLECHGTVIKHGRTLLFTEADVFAVSKKARALVARATHTMASVPAAKVESKKPAKQG